MIDPREVGAVAAAVLTGSGHDGRTYRLTGPAAIGYHEVASELSKATDTVRVITGREPRSFADFARDHSATFAPLDDRAPTGGAA